MIAARLLKVRKRSIAQIVAGLLVIQVIVVFLSSISRHAISQATSRHAISQETFTKQRKYLSILSSNSTQEIIKIVPYNRSTQFNANYNQQTEQEYRKLNNTLTTNSTNIQVVNTSPNSTTVPISKESAYTYPANKHEHLQQNAISRIQKHIDECMTASNLNSPSLLETARQNAQLFMEQYGSVISPQYLDGYVNHCWKTNYHVALHTPTLKGQAFMKGQIDKRNFNRTISSYWFGNKMKHNFKTNYRKGYNTSTVCLPNIYLLGFEKSGSTFFWCLLSNTLNIHHNKTRSKKIQADKEPYYWTPFNYKPALPSPEKLAGEYIPNFLMASDRKIPESTRKKMALIDGCPSTVIEWPRFNDSEPELANYCLLPSALPELFPNSKYLVIMREPVNMMYSAFWWSFTAAPRKSDTLSKSFGKNHTKGPQTFHEKAVEKITQFLHCINSHSTVVNYENCTLWGKGQEKYASCISNRTHLLSQCVVNITTKREFLEAVIHRGIYYVHVRKWLQTIPRERIFFTTMEKLTKDTHIVMNEVNKFFKINKTFKKEASHGMCTTNSNTVKYKKDSLEMKDYTRTMLTKFYEPFNQMLSDLLEDNAYLWNT